MVPVHLPCVCVGGEGHLRKGTNGLCQHFCLTESCPSVSCPDARKLSSSLHISGAFWAAASALEFRRSESKSVNGPFKRKCLGLQEPPPHSATLPAGFYIQNYGHFSSWHWNPGLRGLVWGCDPSLLRGNLHSWDIPSNFYSPQVVVKPVCFMSLSPLPVLMWILL